MPKKKEQTWDEIGQAIGKKIEKEFKSKEYKPWHKPWMVYKEEGGGFGRLLFIIGVMLLLNHLGVLISIPWWISALVIIGFACMRF